MNNLEINKVKPVKLINKTLVERYHDFCTQQKQHWFLWFLMVLVAFPMVLMPIGIFVLRDASFATNYITLSMLLFLLNICSHVGGLGTKTSMALFFTTILFHLCTIWLYLIGVL